MHEVPEIIAPSPFDSREGGADEFHGFDCTIAQVLTEFYESPE